MSFPADLVMPDYGGRCLTGVAGSVRRALGLPPGGPTLPDGLIPDCTFDCVVLVVVDALGHAQMEAHRAAAPALARMLARGRVATLTSVLPTTTTAALTSLFTGLAPGEHGMLGHTLYLRELGILADLLRFHPARLPGRGGLVSGETSARDLFPVATLFQALSAAGIHTRALMRRDLIGTPLSDIHLAGATRVPIAAASDLCVGLRRLVEQGPRPLFVSAYREAVDALAHVYGPGSEEEAAEVRAFFALLEGEFLDALRPETRRNTLILITADHGQVHTRDAEAVRLDEHPHLAARLLMPPAGDRRTSYLYARTEALETLERDLAAFTDRFHVVRATDALADGLFGRGPLAAEAPARVGDLVLLARGGATLVGHEKSPPATPMVGRHGGASAAEMEVPLIVIGDP
ncbi:MAG: alkaline phosphatase family protein [Armatimonadetes bacterium]|nr:alkaline phosphatase family protein [Armatimonadota bacterium]